MTVIKVTDAAANLVDLIRRAASGEEVLLTENGRPVARLSPIDPPTDATSHRRAIEHLKRLSESQRLDGLRIKDLVAEGRR